MTEPKSLPRSSASSSDGTQVSDAPIQPNTTKNDDAPALGRTVSRQTRHEDIRFFSPDGELHRTVSRQQSSGANSHWSTATQDPTADDFDFEKHLKHILRKADKNGVVRRDLGVTFRGLTVKGEGSGISYGPSLTGALRSIPSLPTKIKASRHPKTKVILDDFTGCVKPGEMLLVLGRPGSGCSSFLKTLACHTESFKEIDGTISYDGASPQEMAKHHRGDLAYLPEDDHHLPHLTVGQTLTFASATRTPAVGGRIESRKESVDRKRDVLLSLFGLKHTFNTKVGDDIVRGVSGGERKRVSIAELMTTGCKIGCHDNSTRGLDASTAVEYCRALRIATDLGSLTTVLSIYQAGEQLYELFDKVCVIYAGQQVYFGPMGEAVEYFRDMGYEPQPRQTSADFLVAVTDPKGRFPREGMEDRVPKTPEDFVRHWKNSDVYKRTVDEVEQRLQEHGSQQGQERIERFRESARADHVKRQSDKSPYLISYPMMVRLAMTRRFQMQMGDIATLAIVSIAALFQAIIIGSVYFQMPKDTSGFFSRGGVIFFAILYNSFTGMAEITSSYAQRPIIVRQRGYAMLRPSADILALTLVDLPFKAITIFIFDVVLYFMVGLGYSADQFFIFLLFTYVTNLAMLIFFRALASANRHESNATTLAGIGVLVIAIYVGYAIPRPSMRVYFRWLSYAQPVSFGFEALLANEFRRLNVPCAQLAPSGPGYEAISSANQVCTTAGSAPGQTIVIGLDYLRTNFGYSWGNTWRNFGFIWAYFLFFLAVNLITYEYQRDETVSGGVMLFRRGHAPPELVEAIEAPGAKSDEEKGDASARPQVEDNVNEEEKNAAAEQLKSATDIFTWRNVNYTVPIKGGERQLLADVSGYVAPGKMTALMGESGAGKTTLLNVLAQRVSVGVVTGDMLVNGKPLPISFQRQTGYVQQQDTHMATTTVREALIFSAMLRQPRATPKAEKLAYVEEIITLLEMDSYAEALVGDVGMGLNVEQRKRLTIAVELAAKPALLIFLDEPTSGLDSQSSWSIMLLLRKLADHGQAILATIHQPSSELFQTFDRLLLLMKGGKTVYFGDLGKNSQTMLEYFHARTDKKCGERDNPAEYILDVIGAGAGAKSDKDWSSLWNESDEAKKVQTEIDHFHDEKKNEESQADQSPDSGLDYAAPRSVQFTIVLKRVFQHYSRDPTYVMAKLMLNIVAGLFIGFSFWKSPHDQTGTQNFLFAVFMAVVLSAPLSQQLQPKFLGLRQLYEARERPSRMYSWPIFVISSIIVEMPYNLFCGTVFFLCWYWTVGFPTQTSRAGYAYFMHMLFELYYPTFAQAVASFSPSAMAASVLFSTLFSFVIIFNGVVQPYAQLPYFWRSWMYRLTPFTYLIEGLVTNAMGGQKLSCTWEQFQRVIPPPGQECLSYLSAYNANAGSYAEILPDGGCGLCTFGSGDAYLRTLNMSFSHRWRNLGFMCAYILFNIAAVFIGFYLYSIADWSSLSFKSKKGKKGGAPAPQDKTIKEDAVSPPAQASH
ncbi:ATP-binding cassette transporter snq2 [Rhodotorula kratochvilovae]